MNTQMAVVVIVALLVVGALMWAAMRQRRSIDLKSRFGPEYDHMVQEHGRTTAEKALAKREERIAKLSIRPLTPGERTHYAEMWKTEQAHFVDEPRDAVNKADHLVEEVMKLRGYPMAEFDQRVADISVDHPHLVENYRCAHDIALRNSRGQADTEDLRKAMISYRSLFEDLLEDHRPVSSMARA